MFWYRVICMIKLERCEAKRSLEKCGKYSFGH